MRDCKSSGDFELRRGVGFWELIWQVVRILPSGRARRGLRECLMGGGFFGQDRGFGGWW